MAEQIKLEADRFFDPDPVIRNIARELCSNGLRSRCYPRQMGRQTTTDGAADSLEFHQKIKKSGWNARIIPCFRPDAMIDLTSKGWKGNINALSQSSSITVDSYKKFIQAMQNRRAFFKSMGAVSTDQGVLSPYTHRLTPADAETIFQKALKGKATKEDICSWRWQG